MINGNRILLLPLVFFVENYIFLKKLDFFRKMVIMLWKTCGKVVEPNFDAKMLLLITT